MTGRSESSASTTHDVQLQLSVMQQQMIHLTSAVETQIETLKTTNIPQQNALLSLNSSNQASLPRDFEISTMKTLMLWELWYYGDKLLHRDDLTTKKSKVQLSKAKTVIQCFEATAMKNGYISDKSRLMTMKY